MFAIYQYTINEYEFRIQTILSNKTLTKNEKSKALTKNHDYLKLIIIKNKRNLS